MADVTVRWAGPADAGAGSTYKIEYTTNYQNWVTLNAAQAASSPYMSPWAALTAVASREDTVLMLASTSDFPSSGYGYVDDALIHWGEKTSNSLTDVTWHSGFGSYAAGTRVYHAHESAQVTGIAVSYHAVLFRITHTNPQGLSSPPAYLWYLAPPVAPSTHCTVVTSVSGDLDFEPRVGIRVEAMLAQDVAFSLVGGTHLDQGKASSKVQVTNPFGLVFHQCWRSSAREGVGGSDVPYVFVLDSETSDSKMTVLAQEIPDLPWVLLGQIVSQTQ